jgi:hypothetical protein
MEDQTTTAATPERKALTFDLGEFEGFSFRNQAAILRPISAEEVVNWDHDRDGEAEFWPAGDVPEVALLFKGRSSVTGAELLDLDRILAEMGGDTRHNYLLIHYAVNMCGDSLEGLSEEKVQDHCVQIFTGTNFTDVRREAAFELFELYYPEEFKTWERSLCDGLIFDQDRFLDSPCFCVEEVRMGDEVALLVAAQ